MTEQRTLAARVIAAEKVVAAVRDAFECGMVPNSTAKNGGAPRHSQQVRVADDLRDALAAYDSLTTPSAPAPQST